MTDTRTPSSPVAHARYFSEDEFACPCCGRVVVDSALVGMLDDARELAGVPFVVSSGYRCPEHNAEVGGAPTSAHTLGLAVDVVAATPRERFRILEGLLISGFTRVGISEEFIHCDIDPDKDPRVVWLY